MEQKIFVLEIIDTDTTYPANILATYLVVNPTQEALDGLQDLIDSRYTEDMEWNDDWDWVLVYEYIDRHFTQLNYEEIKIKY